MTAPAAVRYSLLIAGEDVQPLPAGCSRRSIPTTGASWAEIAGGRRGRRRRAPCGAAGDAFAGEAWRSLSPTRRGRLLMRFADAISEHADEIARSRRATTASSTRRCSAQLRVIPEWLYYFGGLADKVEGRSSRTTARASSTTRCASRSASSAMIIPWNSPVLLTMYALAPALAAGNTVVVKPSEHASASVIETVRLAEQVGFPPGVINVVTGDGRGRRARSSTIPGVAQDRVHGQRRDRPADRRARRRTAGRLHARARRQERQHRVRRRRPRRRRGRHPRRHLRAPRARPAWRARARSWRPRSTTSCSSACADGRGRSGSATRWTTDTQMGPIANPPQLARVARMVDEARADGAEVVAGGERGQVDGLPTGSSTPDDPRAASSNDSRIAQEEVFGPVLTVIPFRDEAEAIALANGTRYGLAAGVWTNDVRRAHRVARAAGGGHGLDQPLSRDHLQLAVRRLQGERARARQRRRGDRRVPADQERLVRALERGAGPVRAAHLGGSAREGSGRRLVIAADRRLPQAQQPRHREQQQRTPNTTPTDQNPKTESRPPAESDAIAAQKATMRSFVAVSTPRSRGEVMSASIVVPATKQPAQPRPSRKKNGVISGDAPVTRRPERAHAADREPEQARAAAADAVGQHPDRVREREHPDEVRRHQQLHLPVGPAARRRARPP